jgi:hypothetical protein
MHREPISTAAIIRRVWLGQLLFSAGHALTTGGFLNYFADPYFKGLALAFAVLQITPEAAESLSVITRWIVQRCGNPKTVWWVSLLLGRIAALIIPGVVFAGVVPGSPSAIAVIVGSLAVWYLLLGISYTAYLSWLSQRVPEVNWGRMLASRSIAISLVTIAMTGTAARLVDWTLRETGWGKEVVYPVLFAVGGAICLLSILPLLAVPTGYCTLTPNPCPGERGEHDRQQQSSWVAFRRAWDNIGFRRFLLGSWQLAFFQGLTQTAQFQFSKNILKVSLTDYYSMVSLMLLVQIPLAALSGRLVDRGHDRKVMVLGLLGLSLAMGCWVLAGWYGPGWLWAAYLIWGGFGLVNVAQPSLALKLSPREDNALQLSLYRPIGGLLAAIAGLIGGAILTRYAVGTALAPLVVFQVLFVVSGAGRALAALWFLSVGSCQEIRPTPAEELA